MEFLIGAAVLAALGFAIVWWRSRSSSDLTKSVEDFQRARRALDPSRTKRNQRRKAS